MNKALLYTFVILVIATIIGISLKLFLGADLLPSSPVAVIDPDTLKEIQEEKMLKEAIDLNVVVIDGVVYPSDGNEEAFNELCKQYCSAQAKTTFASFVFHTLIGWKKGGLVEIKNGFCEVTEKGEINCDIGGSLDISSLNLTGVEDGAVLRLTYPLYCLCTWEKHIQLGDKKYPKKWSSGPIGLERLGEWFAQREAND